MNKNYKFIGIIIGIVVIFLVIGYFVFFNNGNDAERFSKEYPSVSENNVFVYKSAKEIIDILENGTGVVYLGFGECKWCQSYVKILNESALESDLDKIYYFNIKKDREKNTDEYQKIVSILKTRLLFDDEGKERVFVPYVAFVLNGKIIDHDYETSVVEGDITPEQYWTKDEVAQLKIKLLTVIEQVNKNICTDCNK